MQSLCQHCWLYSSLCFSMGECSLGSSQWVVLTCMHQSFFAFTSVSPTLLASWKLPACLLCSCSRWVLVPCAAGGTQIVAHCCPAEIQVQELLVWMTAMLSFWCYCVLHCTTCYQLGPSSISVMRFDSMRVQFYLFIYSFFPVMTLKGSVWLPIVSGIMTCECWPLQLCVALLSVSRMSQLTDFLSWQENRKQVSHLGSAWIKNNVIFFPEKQTGQEIDVSHSTWK